MLMRISLVVFNLNQCELGDEILLVSRCHDSGIQALECVLLMRVRAASTIKRLSLTLMAEILDQFKPLQAHKCHPYRTVITNGRVDLNKFRGSSTRLKCRKLEKLLTLIEHNK